jgi:hypothetical protein
VNPIKDLIFELLEVDFIGLEGISLGFRITNNAEYDIKSVDQLLDTFLGGLSDDRWHKSNVEYDSAMDFESSDSCEFVIRRKPKAMYTFLRHNYGKASFSHFTVHP